MPDLRSLVQRKFLLLSLFFVLHNNAFSQIINGNFNQPGVIIGASCNAGTGWTTATGNLSSQYTNLLGPSTNFWIDITPCWASGNGTYIEQTVPTVIGRCYYLKFDLGTHCRWDMSDAGVYISIDGNLLGKRIFNDSFDCISGMLHWESRTSKAFVATGTTTTIRFTGEGRCTKNSPTSGPNQCTPVGSIAFPGVMGIDNIELKEGDPVNASLDTGYYCGKGIPIKALSLSPSAIVNWSVLSGPATISGGGDSINVTANGFSKILLKVTDTSFCSGQGFDTIVIFVPTATVDAGTSNSILACVGAADTLSATLTNTTAGLNYSIDWTPGVYVTYPLNNKLRPVVKPVVTTLFTLKVSLAGCTWTDTVTVIVNGNNQNYVDFSFELHAGCIEDTVVFINKSSTDFGTYSYQWKFGDNSPIDTNSNPIHIYKKQDRFNVFLKANNGLCTDSLSRFVDTRHSVKAAINVVDQRICLQDTILFNGSFSTSANPALIKAVWHFGDGTKSTNLHEKHIYTQPGTHVVLLIVTDTIPCSDTAIKQIEDVGFLLPPYVDIGPSDTTICSDVILELPLGISVRGASYLWSDGSTDPRYHAREPGTYILKLSNQCGYIFDTITLNHKDCSIWFPNVFSPNNDRLNDLARLRGKSLDVIKDLEFSIYNRYGNKIFTTNDVYAGWDGTYNNQPQTIGTYYYYIRYVFENEEHLLKGDITLVR